MDQGPIKLVVTGQSLIKVDPRKSWDNPFYTIRPIIEAADIGFTNFGMAVNPDGNGCKVPADYVTVLGAPQIPTDRKPGDTGGPHAVNADVMAFLSDMNLNLMSLANNHIWDLGPCGVKATVKAAEDHGVTHAGANMDLAHATAPTYLTVNGLKIALIASTTSHDARNDLIGEVNGVWTGHEEDWDRNIAAVKEAAATADFVIYYQHFQIDADEFDGLESGEATKHGHIKVDNVALWQEAFAKAVIDAGASMFLAHGHRGFDGVEIYKGKPLFRQFGGFAYQGLQPVGSYDGTFAFWGLLGILTIENAKVRQMEFVPLELDEGGDYEATTDPVAFYSKRGFAEVATGPVAVDILERFQAFSKNHGVDIDIKGERAFLTIE
jgi:poly-gamma-glutamate capsule biosynthesis protein CapA/YwtB (metallophosphatase superfamily)